MLEEVQSIWQGSTAPKKTKSIVPSISRLVHVDTVIVAVGNIIGHHFHRQS